MKEKREGGREEGWKEGSAGGFTLSSPMKLVLFITIPLSNEESETRDIGLGCA